MLSGLPGPRFAGRPYVIYEQAAELLPDPPCLQPSLASFPPTWRFAGSGAICHRPSAAASAMTGVEVADVMALAQADSRGHLAASAVPIGRNAGCYAGAKPTPPSDLGRWTKGNPASVSDTYKRAPRVTATPGAAVWLSRLAARAQACSILSGGVPSAPSPKDAAGPSASGRPRSPPLSNATCSPHQHQARPDASPAPPPRRHHACPMPRPIRPQRPQHRYRSAPKLPKSRRTRASRIGQALSLGIRTRESQ